jgi:mannose-6-phosphate isomerase-like protein (cupin superfamily)
MKRYRLSDLPEVREGHFLSGIVPGEFLSGGGLGFKKPGFRTHSAEGPGGSDLHVHPDEYEVFVFLQGKGVMQVEGKSYPFTTGDVFVIEPGEDHHLVSDAADPCVNLWLHMGPRRHPDQEA